MKKLLNLMLAMILVMNLGIAYAEYDPVVVQVGKLGFTRSQVREALDLAEKSYTQAGNLMTDAAEEEMRQEVLSYFIRQGVLENKLKELGLYTPTKEEMDELEEEAQEQWEQALTKARKELVTKYGVTAEKAREYAPMYLDLSGITMEELRLELGALWKQNKITEYVTKDVPRVTEAEARDWYTQNLVKPGENAYRDNIEAFETEVVLDGAECYYIPAGYRYVQSIIFLAPEEEREAIQLKMLELGDAEAALETANNELYGCQVLEEDPTEALAAQEAAQTRIDALTEEIDAMKAALAEAFAEQIEDITKRLEAGEDFAALQAEYDQNPEPMEDGYLVCAESVIWEQAFKDGAMSMEKPGDFAGPIYLAAGPQFLYYVQDAPQGALPLDEESLATVRLLAQKEADNKLLTGHIRQWMKEYEIETHEELLRVS